MTAFYLSDMIERAAELRRAAVGIERLPWWQACRRVRAGTAAALGTLATEIEGWQRLARQAEVRKLTRALDEIAEDAREQARLAEQNPGRGPSPAANCPERVAPSAGGLDSARLSRTIDQAFAAAAGDRVVPFRPRPRVVLGDEMGAAAE